MNSKKLIVLCAIAVVAIAAGVWLASERSSSSVQASSALYPDLKKKLNDATSVKIFSAGDELAVEIARKEDSWVVTQRKDYPADGSKVRKLLLALADAQIREEKTSNANNYASLGVEDVSQDSATGKRIEIAGVDPAINLIVGKQGPGLESHYVRRAGEEKSWLVGADLDADAEPAEWLRKSILDVTADRVQSATITTKGAKEYSAVKNSRADADFKIENLPKGKELSFPSAPNSLATALAGLTLSDVHPASEFADKPEARAVYRTFDGLVVEIDGWSRDDKYFVAARASYDAALADRFKIPSETKDETQDQDKKENTAGDGASSEPKTDESAQNAEAAKKDVAAEAKEVTDTVNGWVYEIPQYKYEAVFKPLSEMLKS